MVTSLTAFSSVSSRSWCSGHLALQFPLLAEPLEQAGDAQAMLDAGAVEHLQKMQEVG